MLRSHSVGLNVAEKCYSLIKAARDSLGKGQVEDALGYLQIIHKDSEQFLLNFKTTSVHLEDVIAMQRGLLSELTKEKAKLAEVEQTYDRGVVGHQNDIQNAKLLKDHLEYRQHEADKELCRAERAHQETKNEREAISVWHLMPIFGWIAWGVKNSSCDAKMAKQKQAIDEARNRAAGYAKTSHDVVDAHLKKDEEKLHDAKKKLQDCKKKIEGHHQLIGDLKLALSVVFHAKRAVEQMIDIAGQARNNVDKLAEILDACLTRPAVGQSRGTRLQFEYTEKSWSEVRGVIRANRRLLNMTSLCLNF